VLTLVFIIFGYVALALSCFVICFTLFCGYLVAKSAMKGIEELEKKRQEDADREKADTKQEHVTATGQASPAKDQE
jgi:hypothetical protein